GAAATGIAERGRRRRPAAAATAAAAGERREEVRVVRVPALAAVRAAADATVAAIAAERAAAATAVVVRIDVRAVGARTGTLRGEDREADRACHPARAGEATRAGRREMRRDVDVAFDVHV